MVKADTRLLYLAIGENIRKYRSIRNLSLQEVAEKIGMTKKAVQRYETGETKIDFFRIADIAEALNISTDKLLDGVQSFVGIDINNLKMINLPIVGKVSCGKGTFAIEEIEGYEPAPAKWLNGGEHFYTRAVGDSMKNARINDGDLVLIRRQPDVEDGEIAAVFVDEQIYLKKVFKRNNTIILQSENPDYPPIVCDVKNHECLIIGKLKKIIISQ